MTFFDSILLGVVEGITEFLPISSTGHLMITSHILHITSTEFTKSFEIAVQAGALLAVAVLYFKRILKNYSLIPKIALAFLPTLIAGLLLYPIIKGIFLENIFIVFYSLIIGGIIMIFVEKKYTFVEERKIESITYKESFILGLLQVCALIPGVSRSGATIIGGLALKFPRKFLIEFSFLLALPTIFGATIFDLLKTNSAFTHNESYLLIVGILASSVVAYIVMKKLLHYLEKHSFEIFGWYRIVIGILGLLYFI